MLEHFTIIIPLQEEEIKKIVEKKVFTQEYGIEWF